MEENIRHRTSEKHLVTLKTEAAAGRGQSGSLGGANSRHIQRPAGAMASGCKITPLH